MSQKTQTPALRAGTREEALNLMRPVSERFDPQDAEKNRALVAFELEAASVKVQRFGWSDLDPRMKQRLTDDWVDVLGEYPIGEVRRAIGKCLEDDSRKCPTEQAVKAAIHRYRRDKLRDYPKIEPTRPERDVEPLSDESRAELAEKLRRFGITPYWEKENG